MMKVLKISPSNDIKLWNHLKNIWRIFKKYLTTSYFNSKKPMKWISKRKKSFNFTFLAAIRNLINVMLDSVRRMQEGGILDDFEVRVLLDQINILVKSLAQIPLSMPTPGKFIIHREIFFLISVLFRPRKSLLKYSLG